MVWLLFFAGFCSNAVYPLLVTMARYATGANLGRRMGFIVGGTWGIASVVLIVLGPVADRFGAAAILKYTFIGYLLSGVIGLVIMYNSRLTSRAKTV